MAGKKNSAKEPTIKQRHYVDGVVAGKSKQQAARDAGYSESTARAASATIDDKSTVQTLFRQVLAKAGLTDKFLARRLKKLVHAKEVKFFAKDGKVISKKTVEDNATQHAALVTALRIKGHLRDKIEVSGDDGGDITVRVVYDDPRSEAKK